MSHREKKSASNCANLIDRNKIFNDQIVKRLQPDAAPLNLVPPHEVEVQGWLLGLESVWGHVEKV